MHPKEIIEKHLIFKGHVQGVGFRATAMKYGKQLHLAGTVENLPDGSVEVFLQGTATLIDQFIQAIKAHFGLGLQEIIVSPERVASALFIDFKILR